MLYRTLPGCYPADSAYAKFPLLVPSFLRERLPVRTAAEYDWSKPSLPNASINVSAYRDARTMLADENIFEAGYNVRIAKINDEITLDKSMVCRLYAINCHLSPYTSFRFESFYFPGHVFRFQCNTSSISPAFWLRRSPLHMLVLLWHTSIS